MEKIHDLITLMETGQIDGEMFEELLDDDKEYQRFVDDKLLSEDDPITGAVLRFEE